jgi:hypothetical protein
LAKLGALALRAVSPPFVFARVFAPTRLAWLLVSDSGSETGLADGTSRDCFSRIALARISPLVPAICRCRT